MKIIIKLTCSIFMSTNNLKIQQRLILLLPYTVIDHNFEKVIVSILKSQMRSVHGCSLI